jgi:hypothetical protein
MHSLKLLVLLVGVCYSSIGYSQYYDPNAVNALNNNMMGFLNMGATAYSSGQYGNASYMNAEGNRSLNQSMANINNQTAYSMYLDNRLKQTSTFFDNRQLNSYYRDLEAWQKAERVQLKRYGIYDREAIERLYGR